MVRHMGVGRSLLVVTVALWVLFGGTGRGQLPTVNSIAVLPPIHETPSAELINERQQMVLATLVKLDTRVDDLERALAAHDRQLALIETTLRELVWAGRTLLAMVLTQLGVFLLRRRP